MKKAAPILLAIALLCAAAGCARKPRVIPPAQMSEVYYDLFMADQWIMSFGRARRNADTTAFYAQILEKYGYTVEDYDASVRYYLKTPEKYSDILYETKSMLDEKVKRLQAAEDELSKRIKISPYQNVDFTLDSLVIPGKEAFATPRKDTTSIQKDSLSLQKDSLSVQKDTITQPDTISHDQKRNPEEMLFLHGPDDSTSRRHPVKREIFGRESHKTKGKLS